MADGWGNRSVVCRLAGRVKRRNRKRKKHVICSSEVVAIVSICSLAHHNACESGKKRKAVPSPVHVKAGAKVQLKITAVDHVVRNRGHG
jgi:hypothetical protein